MVLRVYLAADLEFLVDDLVAVGCDVYLMKSASIRHNPGAMWRFLALEAADEWITVNDADRGKDILSDVERSEQAMATTTWPSYDFDEWFLLAVMYPRLAFEGVQTFFHWRFPELSFCHTLDVEYVTWANHGSEVFHCPKPPAGDLESWERRGGNDFDGSGENGGDSTGA